MTAVVLDASLVLTWAVEDERHPEGLGLLMGLRAGSHTARAPAIWWFEVRNALVANERRNRLSEADTAAFLRGLGQLPVSIDRSPDETAVLTLARRHRLTVYDAAYLELAQRDGLPLASFDKALRAAAAACGVPLIGA